MTLTEYLLVLSPSEQVSEYVLNEKRNFKIEFGTFVSEKSIPHITLSNVLINQERSYDFLSQLSKRLENLPNFKINISGFGSFYGSNTIHLNVNVDEAYQHLIMSLLIHKSAFFLRKSCNITDKPHITIARRLKDSVFEKAQQRYISKEYNNTFIANGLTVLQRPYSKNPIKWKKKSFIPFKAA